MSFRFTLLYILWIIGTVVLVVQNYKIIPNVSLLITGQISTGTIEECKSELVKGGRGATHGGRRPTSGWVERYTPVAIVNDGWAEGTNLLGEEWCKSHIGRKVFVILNDGVGKIIMFSQYYGSTVVLLLFILNTYVPLFHGRKPFWRIFSERMMFYSSGLMVSLLAYEYYVW